MKESISFCQENTNAISKFSLLCCSARLFFLKIDIFSELHDYYREQNDSESPYIFDSFEKIAT